MACKVIVNVCGIISFQCVRIRKCTVTMLVDEIDYYYYYYLSSKPEP